MEERPRPPRNPPPAPRPQRVVEEDGDTLTISAPSDYEQSLMTNEEKELNALATRMAALAWRWVAGELHGDRTPQELVQDAVTILQLLDNRDLIDPATKEDLLRALDKQNSLRDPQPVSSLLLLRLSPTCCTKEVMRVGLATYTLLLAVAGDTYSNNDMLEVSDSVRHLILFERNVIHDHHCTPEKHMKGFLRKVLTLEPYGLIPNAMPLDPFENPFALSLLLGLNEYDKCECTVGSQSQKDTSDWEIQGNMCLLAKMLLDGPFRVGPKYHTPWHFLVQHCPARPWPVAVRTLQADSPIDRPETDSSAAQTVEQFTRGGQIQTGAGTIASGRQADSPADRPETDSSAAQTVEQFTRGGQIQTGAGTTASGRQADSPADRPETDSNAAQTVEQPALQRLTIAGTETPGPASMTQGGEEPTLSSQNGEIVTIAEDDTPPPLTDITSEPDSLGDCGVCTEPAQTGQRLCRLPCNHLLHISCSEGWFCLSDTCPLCRQTVSELNPGMLPPGEPRSLAFSTGAHLTNIHGSAEQRAMLRRIGIAGPTLHMSMAQGNRAPTRDNLATEARACSAGSPTQGTEGATLENPLFSQAFRTAIGNGSRQRNSSRRGTNMPSLRRDQPRSASRRQERRNQAPARASANTFSMTPWARRRRSAATNQSQQSAPREEFPSPVGQVLTFSTHVIFAVILAFLLLSLPLAHGEMIDEMMAQRPVDPAQVSKFNLGDVLVFESYPRSVSLALTSEEVDMSILFRLRNKLSRLSKYAKGLAGNNLVPLVQAPGYCRPHGYANSLTSVLAASLQMPHYIEAHEFNSAEKVYVATLREDATGHRYCNYSLSYATKFSLTSVLDLGSSYYTVQRDEKYMIYTKWLSDSRGEPCKDGLTVHRGEIVPADADFEIIINHTDGSIFSCSAYCSNLNGLREQALRSADCILGNTCKPYAKSHCETYSFNWAFNRCRLSSKANPTRDLGTQKGWNSLVAFRECRALVLHQSARILVNGTLHEISHVCKFSHEQASATSSVYRSCPGIANGLQADITPLETTLDRYIISLDSVEKGGENKANHTLTLEDKKGKRGAHLVALPAILTALKPALANFLSIGTAHLSSGVGLKFLGNALPLANLLMLSTNLVALTVGLAIDLAPAIHYEPIAKLDDLKARNFQDWSLVRSPDLYKLHPMSEACRLDSDIRQSDAIPELLKEIGESLKSLQVPLSRLISNAAPLSKQVHGHISEEGGSVYGFWSTYHPSRKALVRYFTYEVKGGPDTMSRQTAVLSGSSVAPISEGTLIQGGTRKPGSIGPNWSCVEYIINAQSNGNNTWLPEACYGAPLNPKPIYSTAFLPNARIYRIFGRHRVEYSCPRSSQGSVVSRGLLVLLVPNECLFLIDSVSMRNPDLSSVSVWAKPIRLVDRTSEYEARKNAAYPKSLHRAISTLANETLMPAIANINLVADDSRKVQHQNDVGLTVAICVLAILGLAAICLIYWKLHREHDWPLMTSQALAARLRFPSFWTNRSPDADIEMPNTTTTNEANA